MLITNNLWIVIAGFLPFFSGITWVLVMLFSLQDCITRFELRVKQILLCFFGLSSVNWFSALAYYYQSELFSYISPLAEISFLLTPIVYYQFVCMFTRSGTLFSRWHFLFPCIILVTEIVWLFLISYPVQQEAIEMRSTLLSSLLHLDRNSINVYHRYTIIESLSALLYTLLTLWQLIQYYKQIRAGKKVLEKPFGWIMLLAVSLFAIMAFVVYILVTPQRPTYFPEFSIIIMLPFILFSSLLGYMVLRRQFMLYLIDPQIKIVQATRQRIQIPPLAHVRPANATRTTRKRIAEVTKDSQGREVIVRLTQKQFEEYMNRHKPYLNTQLKITDLIKPLKTNRTFISNFINQTYGLNFNQYMNALRLKEFEQLSKHTANDDKKMAELIKKAGFANKRNYMRALDALQDNTKK